MKKQTLPFLILLALCTMLFSCKNTLSFTLTGDNQIAFEADCDFGNGSAIQQMLAGVGTDFNDLNLDDLKAGLESDGFKNVEVYPKNKNGNGGLIVKGILPPDSPIITASGDSLTFSLSPLNFRDFYHGSGENLATILDLFLIPVLADDEVSAQMDEKGYLDLIASFYGQPFADEISQSTLKILLKNKKQNTAQKTISFATLFTIKSTIEITL